MSRISRAWRASDSDQRRAALASLGLLVAMFFPWYGLQSLDRRTGVLYSRDITAFGDVSFVEAAILLVALGVVAMVFARVEGRHFRLPGGDGTVVTAAGAWSALLIFYRVFDRPTGNGYPVGIEWGLFLAFAAAGALAYAGLRMRAGERPEPPLRRRRPPRPADASLPPEREPAARAPVAAPARSRPRYPPAPGEQLSLEDPPVRQP